MLAGCSGKTENNENNGDQNQVVAASVADYANNLMTAAQKNVFKFENSSDLTAALKKVASDSTKFGSTDIKNISDNLKTSFTIDDLYENGEKLRNELKDELDLDFVHGYDLATVSKEGTRTQGFVYAVSGKLTEAAAVQLIGGEFVKATVNNTTFPAKYDSYKCDSAWVVAIVVTQDAVKVSNT